MDDLSKTLAAIRAILAEAAKAEAAKNADKGGGAIPVAARRIADGTIKR